jgi:N-acetylglucosaminyldiphosphoundecaprenol N-acetyl-beta-D-mannosaminyltransferase
VYVALGAPKEERLIEALLPDFSQTWWIGVGISLSFIAGDFSRAPVWMQKAGIEWLHRMIQEPRRLGPRYLTKNLPFVLRLVAGAWSARS